jgi:hypothetical protein
VALHLVLAVVLVRAGGLQGRLPQEGCIDGIELADDVASRAG